MDSERERESEREGESDSEGERKIAEGLIQEETETLYTPAVSEPGCIAPAGSILHNCRCTC